MSRRHVIMLVAATALAGPVLLAPTQTTGAYWSEQLDTETLAGVRSDDFGITTKDVTAAVVHSQPNTTEFPDVPVANFPGVSIRNKSMRHSSWIDVVSTRVTVPGITHNELLLYGDLDYEYAASCNAPTSGLYWDITGDLGPKFGVDAVKPDITYTRSPATKVTDAELQPGTTKQMCPVLKPVDNTSTVAGQRGFLIVHAGRQLDITTTLRQRSFEAGTWTSNQMVVNTRYQAKLPPPTTPFSAPVCSVTDSYYAKLHWAWPLPFPLDSTQFVALKNHPAIDRFVVMRQKSDKTWAPFRPTNDQSGTNVIGSAGNLRESGPRIDAKWINNSDARDGGVGPYVNFLVRAFLYPNNNQIFVDSDWIVPMRQDKRPTTGLVQCGTPIKNVKDDALGHLGPGPFGLDPN